MEERCSEREVKSQFEKLAVLADLERRGWKAKASKLERKSSSVQAGQSIVALTKALGLPGFVNGKENFYNYVLRLREMIPLEVGNKILGQFD